MNNTRYDYCFERGRLHPHEIAILGSESSGPFFGASFQHDPDGIRAVYQCSGFKPLSSFKIEATSDILYILEKVLLILNNSLNYLLIPERILLSPDTVFYRQETGDVKVVYIPQLSSNWDIHRNLLQFLIGIKGDVCDTFSSYINTFAQRSTRDNLDIASMLDLVGTLRRELERDADTILR